MDRIKRASLVVVVAVVLSTLTVGTAHADTAPAVRPHPEVSVDFGWVPATIYLNRTETNRLASLGYSSAVLCGAVAAVSGGPAALACLLGFPRLVNGAQSARSAGQCAGLRFYIGSPAVSWTVRHSGSRC